MSTRTDVPWLTAEEQHLWRGWLRLNAQLSAALQREMQEDSGLSSSDFEVLVNLTDNADGRIRVSDLATQLLWGRSRVSHHVTRMEGRGLVCRAGCAEDGRGAWVAITPAGRSAIERAAPEYVLAVRRLVFDALSAQDVATMSSLVDRLQAQLDEGASPCSLS